MRQLICPAQEHFICSHCWLYLWLVSSPWPICSSLYPCICDVEHTSLHVGLCGRKFVLCLFGQCPCICTIIVIAGSTQELYRPTCLFGQIARLLFKYIRVFGVCRPACHDSSVLFQVHVSVNSCAISTLFTCIGVLSSTITFVFAMFILRHICLLKSDRPCSICCSSCGVSVYKNMALAKRKLVRNYSPIFTPLFSQFNLLNMLSSVAVNSLNDMVSPVLLLSWSWFSHSLRAYLGEGALYWACFFVSAIVSTHIAKCIRNVLHTVDYITKKRWWQQKTAY